MKMTIFLRIMRRVEKWGGFTPFKIGIATLVILLSSATGFYYFEGDQHPDLSWFDGLWWAFVTMSTVGYGDISPTTTAGRYLVAFPTMLLGISILGYTLSSLGSALLERHSMKKRGLMTLKCKEHIIIVHYPGFEKINKVINQLQADSKCIDKQIVLIDDELTCIPEELAKREVLFVSGHPAKSEVLKRANIEKATNVIILSKNNPDSDSRALAVVLMMETIHPDIHSVVECTDPDQVKIMKTAGADSVVCIATMSANLLVQEMVDPGVQDVISQMTSNTFGSQIYITEAPNLGASLVALGNIKKKYTGINVIGVKQMGKFNLNPTEELLISAADSLVCIAKDRPSFR